jgi:hypothetical protein
LGGTSPVNEKSELRQGAEYMRAASRDTWGEWWT